MDRPIQPTRRRFLRLAGGGASLAALRAQQGFRPLFNGVDLEGWEGDPFLWKVEDGVVVGRSPGIPYNDFLASNERFGDFTLRFKVHLKDNVGNSGMQFRSERVSGSMEMIGYQADVGPSWWGDLYDESRRRTTLVDADEKRIQRILKPNDFNDYEIQAQGSKITLKLNGRVTAEYEEQDASIPREGRLGLQIHSGPALEVRFKDVVIREG